MTKSTPSPAWLLLVLLLVPLGAFAGYGDALNMPEGVTALSRDVHQLHMRIFYICCAIGVLVFGVMFVSIFLHRKSRGAKAADFHESTTVEIVWTIVPLVILVAMAIPAARVLITMEDFSDSQMTIKVTGYQWRWQYEYMDEDNLAFFSQLDPAQNAARQKGSDIDLEQFGDDYLKEVDNPLVVPINTKIRFLHTAADVIHSWWMPDLALKKDAIPGFINENWATIEQPGVYRGKCAELCGRDHGFMPIVVHAVTADEFETWKAEKKEALASAAQSLEIDSQRQWTQDALVKAGAQVYENNCVACHQSSGQGIPGMFPAIAGSPVVTGDMDTHLATVLHGVQGTPMQGFAGQLNDIEMAAVITYQRNAFGNGMGDSLQPFQVKSLRDGLQQTRLVLPDEPLSALNGEGVTR